MRKINSPSAKPSLQWFMIYHWASLKLLSINSASCHHNARAFGDRVPRSVLPSRLLSEHNASEYCVCLAFRPAEFPFYLALRAFIFLNCAVSWVCSSVPEGCHLCALYSLHLVAGWSYGSWQAGRVGCIAGSFLMESCLLCGISYKCMLHGKTWQQYLISTNCFSFDELVFS